VINYPVLHAKVKPRITFRGFFAFQVYVYCVLFSVVDERRLKRWIWLEGKRVRKRGFR